MKIDLSQFQKDHTFYGELNFLLTVKSFDLQAIRKRYLASKKNNRSGSVERRKSSFRRTCFCDIKKWYGYRGKGLIHFEGTQRN